MTHGTPAPRRLLERVDRAMEEGEAWRAKEMLSGALGEFATEPDVLLAYARVLDQLGDRLEAGKYYFLSGFRGEETQGPTDLFVRRHGRKSVTNLIGQFPSRVKAADLDRLPPIVLSDLEAMGFDTGSRTRLKDPVARDSVDTSWGYGWGLGCAVVFVLVVLTFLNGIVPTVKQIAEMLRKFLGYN